MRIPGVRFYPTDEELVMYHLKNKVLGKKHFQVIGEICIYRYAPWDLPDRSLLRTGDLKWYFFCPVERKYAGSVRMKRSTDLGCWTTSGKDRKVYHNSVVVGTIRTLIFYKGKSPNGERTDWVMYEYKLEGKEWAEKGIAQDIYVLCVIFKKDGLGPKNGAQYGAPFKEEDWDSEVEVELGDRHFSSISVSTLTVANQDNPSTSHVPFNYAPENMSIGQSTSCPLETWPPVHHTVVLDTNASTEASHIVAENCFFLVGTTMLLPGFRFYPTDEELVMYHLKNKVLGKKCSQVIGEIYIYRYAPWDLPDRSSLRTGDLKWYFFCPVKKKYAGSFRMNRSADLGYWTTSGKDRKVHHNSVVVGRIRTLIFHKGKSPNGERTDWVMYEYKLEGTEWTEKGIAQDMYVLCVIFKKDGLGPKNGAQYGAPFKEEDWDSEEEVELGDRHLSSIGVSTLTLASQDNPSTSHVPFNYAPENMSVGQSTSCPLETLPPIHHTVVPDTNANAEASQTVAENDDILEMLDMFYEESEFLAQKPENSDRVDSPNKVEGVQTDNFIDGNDFFEDLEDLDNLAGFDQPERNAIPSGLPAAFCGEQTFPGDNLPYLELRDFDDPLNSLGGFDSIKQIDNNTEYTNNCNYESENFQLPSNTSNVHISKSMSLKTCQSGHSDSE